MLDLDKLHKSILDWNNTFSTRRSGKTVILIHQIIGEIQLGLSPTILVMMPNLHSIKFLKTELRKFSVGQGITLVSDYVRTMTFKNEEGKEIIVEFCVNEEQKIGFNQPAEYELDY